MGVAVFGDNGQPVETMLRNAVIGMKYRPLSDWTTARNGTMTMTVERF